MTQEFRAGTIDHTLLKPDAVSHHIAQLFKGLSSTNLFSGCFSCAIGPTGKPLKNQCNNLDHSFLIKYKSKLPVFHSYQQLLQRFFSFRME